MRTEKITCDIKNCGNEVTENGFIKKEMQVIFDTDQTEGRSSKPYFDKVVIDLCERCIEMILVNHRYILASGAQGYNTYTL